MTGILDTEVSTAELAALVGVTDRRIRQLVEAGKLTRTARNRFRLGTAVQTLFAEAEARNDTAEIQAERLRKLRAEATMAELDLAKARSEVALISEFELVEAHTAILVRTNMMNIPQRVVSQVIGSTDEAHIKAALKNEIVIALRTAHAEILSTTVEDLENHE